MRQRISTRIVLLTKCKKQQEQKSETLLLHNIQNLPIELIRIIETYTCGLTKEIINEAKHKFRCNWLKKMLYNNHLYDLNNFYNIILKLSKEDIIKYIQIGTLKTCPKLVNKISVYNYDIHASINGTQLIQLWKDGLLLDDYDEEDIKYTIYYRVKMFFPSRVNDIDIMESNDVNACIRLLKSLIYVARTH